jgi:TolB protein
MRSLLLSGCLVLLIIFGIFGMLVPLSAQAQQEQRCFSETGLCISGRIREMWETQGGLPVFGLPISPLQEETINGTTNGQTLQVQWFERQRVELHPENPAPHDILLGPLGVEWLQRHGGDIPALQHAEPQSGCRYIEETGHNICGEFLLMWQTNGIEQDGIYGISEEESKALFGLPLSESYQQAPAQALADDTDSTDDTGNAQPDTPITVQWFERARLELHPNAPFGEQVQISALGTAIRLEQGHAPPSPPPRALAFMSNRTGDWDIYTVREDGSELVNLTNHPSGDGRPTWSPDGSRIAFFSDRDGDTDIYVMSADGTNITQLTDSPGHDVMPAWSPDGLFLAFSSMRDGNNEIYVMNANGTGQYNVTNSPSSYDSVPAWSPDSQWLLFTSDRTGNSDVYKIHRQGWGLENLTHHAASDEDAVWSPDGTHIAFTSNRNNNDDIYVMDSNGWGVTNLTNHPANDAVPAWSPDGTHIAFLSDRGGNADIYMMNVEPLEQTGEISPTLTRLTDHPGDDFGPMWAPTMIPMQP